MKMLTNLMVALGVVALWGCRAAEAKDVDPATLYDISTQGTSEKVKAGEGGKVVIEIRAKKGAHVSEEAPLRIELKGKSVKPSKEKLTLADSVAKKEAGQQYPNPRFEVPFEAGAAGKGGVDAKLTFFICTETLCARQQKTLTMPVEVQ